MQVGTFMSLCILLYTKGSWSSADRTQKVAVNEAFPRPKLNLFDLPLVTATPSLGPLPGHLEDLDDIVGPSASGRLGRVVAQVPEPGPHGKEGRPVRLAVSGPLPEGVPRPGSACAVGG